MYLDANFFILLHFDYKDKGEKSRQILEQIIKGKSAVTSVLTLDEVMWVIVKNKQEKELRNIIEEIYSIKNLIIKDVSNSIPLKALDIMEENKLKPRDAFHIAIMKELGINTIVSDDKDFDKIQGIKRIKLD